MRHQTGPDQCKIGEAPELSEGFVIDLATQFTKASKQRLSRCARSILPTCVLFSGIALLTLQYPLQRIIHYPPVLVELGYKTI